MRILRWLNFVFLELSGLVGIPERDTSFDTEARITRDLKPPLSQFLQDRVKATRKMSALEILERARSESQRKCDCPNCGQMLIEHGCEACDHRTDGRDCICDSCNPPRKASPGSPVLASIQTNEGGLWPQTVEVTVHELSDRTQFVFAPPTAIRAGETVCLTFAPMQVPSGRWDWYGTVDANADA